MPNISVDQEELYQVNENLRYAIEEAITLGDMLGGGASRGFIDPYFEKEIENVLIRIRQKMQQSYDQIDDMFRRSW